MCISSVGSPVIARHQIVFDAGKAIDRGAAGDARRLRRPVVAVEHVTQRCRGDLGALIVLRRPRKRLGILPQPLDQADHRVDLADNAVGRDDRLLARSAAWRFLPWSTGRHDSNAAPPASRGLRASLAATKSWYCWRNRVGVEIILVLALVDGIALLPRWGLLRVKRYDRIFHLPCYIRLLVRTARRVRRDAAHHRPRSRFTGGLVPARTEMPCLSSA